MSIAMKDPNYWKTHYVVESELADIESCLRVTSFVSGRTTFQMPFFEKDKRSPNILVSQGSGGHSYVFVELAYQMYLRGYNVFIMPKHGGTTISQLMPRHLDALRHISASFGGPIGLLGEGLGGYVSFYLALNHAPIKSLACQNSPAVMTEREYLHALLNENGMWADTAQRRRFILPLARLFARALPELPIPISSYLDWRAIIDPRLENRELETALVVRGYLQDPDFDRWYPLKAVMSLLFTPPPGPLQMLETPTLFAVTRFGPTPSYIMELFARLPPIKKKMVEIDGSVYWMLAHPTAEAKIVCDWFDETI